MKIVITICFGSILLSNAPFAQNVGIGNSNPTEKLDVNGNINVSGTIKVNGIDGTANQVLMKNSSGELSWGGFGEFKNSAMFLDTSQSIIWTVPAGVERILVELWGGGGAGMEDGGGSGAYLVLIFDKLSEGNSFTITVGKGAKDDPTVISTFTYAKNGTESILQTPINGSFFANGGTGAFKNPTIGQWVPGRGGTYSYTKGANFSPFLITRKGRVERLTMRHITQPFLQNTTS